MRTLRALMIRLANVMRRQPADAGIQEEIEAHIAMDTERGLRSGLSEAEARRQALIRLGGAQQVREAQMQRDGLPWLESLLRDLRYGLRALTKRPGVTAIAILSIGLGIGANTTVFSIVNRLVLEHGPMTNPATLLTLHTVHVGEGCCNPFSWPLYNDVRTQTHSFSDVAAYCELIPAAVGGDAEPERVWGQGVTSNFFSVTGVPMVLGHGLEGMDDRTPSVVLSERLWRRRFGADAAILGRTVKLSGKDFTVAGIVTGSFHSIDRIQDAEFWVPIGMARQLVATLPPMDSREYHWMIVVARLRPGVMRSAAKAELDTLAGRLALTYPDTDRGNSFAMEQAGSLPPRERTAVLLFLAALSTVVLLLLAIAGANVANLLFAQGLSRQREMAVRLALGATRMRLQRQMLMESTLLGVGGGAFGVLLSACSTRALSTLRLPVPVPLDMHVNLDLRTLGFTFALSILSGVVLGMGPAWAAAHPHVANALKGGEAQLRFGRKLSLRNLLVVTQVSLALVLLSITGLFLRSLQSASRIDIGFRPQGLLMLSIDPRLNGYSPARILELLTRLRERSSALPGVDAAVSTDLPLLSGGNRSDGFTVAGRADKDNRTVIADLFMVSPGFFEALGVPRLAGRDFGGERADGPKTAVVNQAFAERLFGRENPIGQHVNGGGWTYEIIGVVKNAKSRTVGEEARPMLYRSLDQSVMEDPSLMGYTLVVHSKGDPALLSEALRRQVYALDPGLAIYNEETMEEHVRTAYFLPRLAATLFGIFGAMGLVLAVVGLYGVMSFAVRRRTREIGIRMALGARPAAVQRFVVRQGMTLVCIALLVGWPAAWALARLSSSFLYGIAAHDAVTFISVPVVLAAAALVACWIPARSAARVNPTDALRAE